MKTAAMPSALLDFASIVLVGLALYQERRRVEALHSKRIYKQVVDALPDCLNIKDMNGKFIAANPATAESDAGVGREGADRQVRLRLLPEGRRAEVPARTSRPCCAAASLSPSTSSFDHGDGVPIWLSTLKTPLTDYKGKIIGLITHNRDITERKELENQLAASRIQLSDALDPHGRRPGDVRCVGPDAAVQRAVPRDVSQDRACPGAGLFASRHPARRDRSRRNRHAARRGRDLDRQCHCLAGMSPATAQIQTGDGRWLDVRARPTDDGGTAERLFRHHRRQEGRGRAAGGQREARPSGAPRRPDRPVDAARLRRIAGARVRAQPPRRQRRSACS